MARVAREMVEKTGINVNDLLDLLVKNAAAELTTFYYYTILRVNLIGLEGEGLKEITEDARIEDGRTFVTVNTPRMYRLVNNREIDTHELTLVTSSEGLALYAFTFGSCLAEPLEAGS